MEIFGKINIAGCASYLPAKKRLLPQTIAAGLYDEKDHQDTQYESIAVEEEKYPAEMGLISAKQCLLNAGFKSEDIHVITYTGIHRHGHKRLWSPASYLQRTLGLNHAIPYSITQGCNSQMIAIQLMISQLLADGTMQAALSVSADRFNNSAFNRWNSDYCIVYGDAAASVLLTKRAGIAQILDVNTVSAPEMEELHRNQKETPETPDMLSYEHNIREAKKAFLGKHGKTSLSERTKLALSKLYTMTFEKTNIDPSEVKYYIMPNLGKKLLDESYYPVFNYAKDKSLWYFGKTVGHLGSGDCIVGLSHLLENNLVQSGDIIFLLGAGAGFTWSTLLLQIN